MSKMKTMITSMFVVLLLSLLSIGNIYAQDTGEADESIGTEAVEDSGKCKFVKNVFVAGRGGNTTSTSFVAVPFAKLTVTNNKKSCFRIIFSAEAWTSGSTNLMYIEARIDGSSAGIVPSTAKQFVATTGSWGEYHTAVFTDKDVAPGTHTVEMYYRSFTGTSVTINEFHLSVDYKK